MTDIVAAWPLEAQIAFLFALPILAVPSLWIVTRGLVIILRGYPPSEFDQPSVPSCEHDDNLTGRCVKIGGPCLTRDECDAEIRKGTPLPTVGEQKL